MATFIGYAHLLKLRFRHWAVVGVVLLASLVILDVSLYSYAERPGGALNPYELRISSVEWFLEEYLLTTGPGFNAPASAALTVILSLTNCALFCNSLTIGSATTSTSGFAVVESNFPIDIAPGATGNLSVTFSVPGSGYSGPLAVVLGH